MKKIRSESLDSLIKRYSKNDEFRILFDQKRFYLQVSRLVSELRAKSGISQAELAKRARVSQPMIARLESGDHRRTPTLDTVFKILKVLGYSLELSVKPEHPVTA